MKTTYLNVYLSILFLVLFISGCKQEIQPSQELVYENGTLKTQIICPAGEIYPPFNKLEIPPFFNIGAVNTASQPKTIVLGKRLGKGKQVNVHPIGLIEFMMDSIQTKYVVSSHFNSMDHPLGRDFNTFVSANSELQIAIENWFRAQ